MLTVLVCRARYCVGVLCGNTPGREVPAGCCRSRAPWAGSRPRPGEGGDEPRPHARMPADRARTHRACQVCDFVAAVGVTAQPEAVTMLHNAAGEAFITLESKSQETEVLKANRQQVGKRYLNPDPQP